MRGASERDDSALYKWRGFWETIKLAFKPVHVPGKKAVRVLHLAVFWKCKYGGAFGMADFE
jgi:hypothetical protein